MAIQTGKGISARRNNEDNTNNNTSSYNNNNSKVNNNMSDGKSILSFTVRRCAHSLNGGQ